MGGPTVRSAVGRMSRWWCRVPRCGAEGDGSVSDWRRHYITTHMNDARPT